MPSTPAGSGGSAKVPEASNGRCGQRDKFVTGPGPDAGGSNQGKAGCVHTPVKFGGAAPSVVVPAATAAPDGMV